MKDLKHNFRYFLMLGMAGSIFASCSSDGPAMPSTGVTDVETTASFVLTASAPGAFTRSDSDFMPGSADECFIDIPGRDFKFLIFSGDDDKKFISEMTDVKVIFTGYSSDLATYSVSGKVKGISDGSKIRIVALANWNGKSATDLYPVLTEDNDIDYLCTHENAVFNRISGLPGEKNQFLIPFFGVDTFDVKFDGANHFSAGEIHLLRGLAKIEVRTQARSACPLKSVRIRKVWDKGYCAPKSVYTLTDYVKDIPSDNYSSCINIPQTGNHLSEHLPFQTATSEDGETVHFLYVPEFVNSSGDNERSWLELEFEGDTSGNVYRLDFRRYASATDSDFFDLRRNWWYRYEVSKSSDFEWTVDIRPYTEVILQPGFGLDRTADGHIFDVGTGIVYDHTTPIGTVIGSGQYWYDFEGKVYGPDGTRVGDMNRNPDGSFGDTWKESGGNGYTYHLNGWILTKDGHWMDAEFNIYDLVDGKGVLIRIPTMDSQYWLGSDGKVFDVDGVVLGNLNANGHWSDTKGNTYDSHGWMMTKDGLWMDKSKNVHDSTGMIIRTHLRTGYWIDSDRYIYNEDGQKLFRQTSDTSFWIDDFSGNVIHVYLSDGTYIGQIPSGFNYLDSNGNLTQAAKDKLNI